jgi:hypothetical protein
VSLLAFGLDILVNFHFFGFVRDCRFVLTVAAEALCSASVFCAWLEDEVETVEAELDLLFFRFLAAFEAFLRCRLCFLPEGAGPVGLLPNDGKTMRRKSNPLYEGRRKANVFWHFPEQAVLASPFAHF